MKLKAIGVVCALLALAASSPAHGQSLSTADLAGTWSLFQLAAPSSTFTGADVRSYSGTLTFDATGTVTTGTLTDDQATGFTVSGTRGRTRPPPAALPDTRS
jgi:hypothetical protein